MGNNKGHSLEDVNESKSKEKDDDENSSNTININNIVNYENQRTGADKNKSNNTTLVNFQLNCREDLQKKCETNTVKQIIENGSKEKNETDLSPSKVSNYTNNIKMTTAELKLNNENKGKESTLLAESKTVVKFSPIWKQTLAVSASILVTFTVGLTLGFSAILLPQLKEANSPIHGNEDTASWIASMAALPMAPGCLLSGWLMEKFGRRTSHYISCVPAFIGWILIACSSDLSVMLIGRFFTGLCVGLLGPLGPVYIGETTEPKYRGFFLSGVSLAMAAGMLVTHLIGTFLTWIWTAIICCMFPVVSIFILIIVPESPIWLISKGRTEEGIKSFLWLRGHSEEARIELKALIDKHNLTNSEEVLSWKEKFLTLKSPELWKPLVIMIIFFITCQFSGVNAVAFYSIEIVEKTVGSGMNHYVAMLIIDSVRVIMSVVACIVCKQFGRRPLCFISGIWTALSMVGLSMYLYFTDGKSVGLSWLPLSCLAIYICAVTIGLVPLPWIMCGEVFPTRVRGLGSGISSASAFAAFFIVVKTAPGMMKHLGDVVTFLVYGIVALIGTTTMYFVLPETKGKSLQEIEDKFKSIPKC